MAAYLLGYVPSTFPPREGASEGIRHPAAEAEMGSTSSRPPGHIKRPMNPFILWSKRRRKELAQENPHMDSSALSKCLGAEWKALSDKDKLPYIEDARRIREKHARDHPGYVYRPRRKSKNAFKRVLVPYAPPVSNIVPPAEMAGGTAPPGGQPWPPLQSARLQQHPAARSFAGHSTACTATPQGVNYLFANSLQPGVRCVGVSYGSVLQCPYQLAVPQAVPPQAGVFGVPVQVVVPTAEHPEVLRTAAAVPKAAAAESPSSVSAAVASVARQDTLDSLPSDGPLATSSSETCSQQTSTSVPTETLVASAESSAHPSTQPEGTPLPGTELSTQPEGTPLPATELSTQPEGTSVPGTEKLDARLSSPGSCHDPTALLPEMPAASARPSSPGSL